MSDSRPRTPGGSLAVDTAKHATYVITSLRSALSSQRRYQTGQEGIQQTAFNNIIAKAKEDSDRHSDLAARAERALYGEFPAAQTEEKNSAATGKNKGPSASASSSHAAVASQYTPATKAIKGGSGLVQKSAHKKSPGCAEVLSKGDSDFSSDDEDSMKEVPVRSAASTDDPAIYGVPRKQCAAASTPVPKGSTSSVKPVVQTTSVVNMSAKASASERRTAAVTAAASCADDLSLYGLPPRGPIPSPASKVQQQSQLPPKKEPSRGKAVPSNRSNGQDSDDNIDFSSDDDADTDRYTKYIDAPPALPADDMMCGSARSKSAYDGEEEAATSVVTHKSQQHIGSSTSAANTRGNNKHIPANKANTTTLPLKGPKSTAARSMSAGGNGVASPKRTAGAGKIARKKKVSAGDFSDDERDDDELAMEHDLFGGDGEVQVKSYSDVVKRSTAPSKPESVHGHGSDGPTFKAGGDSLTSSGRRLSTNSGSVGNAVADRAAPAGDNKRVIIKPGQGIKVVRGAKKHTTTR